MSSENHNPENIVKEHIAADIWKTYYVILPAHNDCAPWDITYSFLEEWPDITIDDLSVTAEKMNQVRRL